MKVGDKYYCHTPILYSSWRGSIHLGEYRIRGVSDDVCIYIEHTIYKVGVWVSADELRENFYSQIELRQLKLQKLSI